MHLSRSITTLLLSLSTASLSSAYEITNIFCNLQDPDTSQFIGGYDPEDLSAFAQDLEDNGTCSAPAGPGACVRVACGETTGIFLCNDNPFPISPSCSDVANIVGWPGHGFTLGSVEDSISDHCGYNGQAFTSDGWNVVAAYANCNVPSDRGPFRQIDE